jgi:hypothetical protein
MHVLIVEEFKADLTLDNTLSIETAQILAYSSVLHLRGEHV